jgi:hypothetical protein
MKRCASPANTTCIYQRIARDQADPDAPDLGAPDPGASSDAYNALCVFLQENLSPDVLGEAEALLRQFLDKSGDGNLAADEPVSGRSRPVLSMDEMQRRVAVGAKISAGRTIAQQYLFNQRFPDAARIRSV